MIVVQTPLRISFLGGGTDFRQYFQREEGWVVSSAIDRYIFVIIKRRFDSKIRIGYSTTEMVESVDDIQHELVRECLRKTGIDGGVEISTLADIPSAGSGMGSSSTVTVGLLNAMYHYLGEPRELGALAQEACEIEIDIVGKPIGIQDQYIAAYGGQRFLHFGRNGEVRVESLAIDGDQSRRLSENLLLFFSNITRKSETILSEQVDNIDARLEVLAELKRLALEAKAAIEAGELDEFGRVLDRGWQAKKMLASRVSNGLINDAYEAALQAGALGGKITGAGGGGFLLLYCPRDRQDKVRAALDGWPELSFNLERDGSKVIFNYRR